MNASLIAIYKNRLFVVLCIVMYVAMYGVMVRYFNNPYLWYDEAGQFWIAKGLNHDSDPLSTCGTLSDVITNNRNYNLDPGGFSVMLHYWSMISNHHRWLRMLPFIFFILTNAGFACLSYKWTKNKYLALIIGLVPFLVPMILNEAFEIRAYSMEVLGCVICVIAIDSLQKKLTLLNLALWSTLIAIFLTSRYSFIIVAFLTSLYVLYLIFKQHEELSRKIVMSTVYALPLFVVLGMDYSLSLRYQNPHLDTLSYLPYINETPSVIFTHSSMLLLMLLLIIAYLAYHYRKHELFDKYKGLVFVTLSTNVLFFLFSVIGVHPWSGDCSRCISMITLVVLCICAIGGELFVFISQRNDIKFIILSCFLILLISSGNEVRKAYIERSNAYTEFLSSRVTPESKVFVDRWEAPCFRYLFEYGKLKNNQTLPAYPEQYTFIKSIPHNQTAEKISSKEWYDTTQPTFGELYGNYDIVIAPELYRFMPDADSGWRSINNQNRVFVHK